MILAFIQPQINFVLILGVIFATFIALSKIVKQLSSLKVLVNTDTEPDNEIIVGIVSGELKKGSIHASGYDIYSSERITLDPLERKLVNTDLFLEIPTGYEAQVRPRSGLSYKQGVTVLNSPGTIDSDYKDEIKVILINLSSVKFDFPAGTRIAQLVFSRVITAKFEKIDSLSESERGSGGFGSTDIN